MTFCQQQHLKYWYSGNYTQQKVIFLRHFAPKGHFLTVTQSVQIGRFWASIVTFARGVTFPKSDILKNVHSRDAKKLFFSRKHWGSEPILTFRNATNLQKIWNPLFRVVTLHLQACKIRSILAKNDSEGIPISFRRNTKRILELFSNLKTSYHHGKNHSHWHSQEHLR